MLATKLRITDAELVKLVTPSFTAEADEEDWVASRRRFYMTALTEAGIFHSDATRETVSVERFDWPKNEDKDIFLPNVKVIYKKFKGGCLKEVPANYQADVVGFKST